MENECEHPTQKGRLITDCGEPAIGQKYSFYKHKTIHLCVKHMDLYGSFGLIRESD